MFAEENTLFLPAYQKKKKKKKKKRKKDSFWHKEFDTGLQIRCYIFALKDLQQTRT